MHLVQHEARGLVGQAEPDVDPEAELHEHPEQQRYQPHSQHRKPTEQHCLYSTTHDALHSSWLTRSVAYAAPLITCGRLFISVWET